jgi:glycine/D-amino acid oxidase-like deaminating enzyme
MSAYSHAYYADLKRRHPRLPIHPVRATLIDGTTDRYLPQAAPTPAEPGPAMPPGSRAWRIAGAHHCDVYQLTQELAAQLRPSVIFAEGVAVTAIEPNNDGVTVRTSTDIQITGTRVILAPGPWLTAPAWRDLLNPLRLRVKRVVALHIDRQPSPADEAILFDADDAFLLPLVRRGHWLFSYASPEWDVDPDRPPDGLPAREFQTARDLLRRYEPTMADACHGGRMFCDAYSPGREPVVQALDPAGRIVFAGAACGSGYRLAPAIAAEATNLVHRHEGVPGDRQYV